MYNPSNNVLLASLIVAILLTVLVVTVGNAPILVCAQTGVATFGILFGYVCEAAVLIQVYKACLFLEATAYLVAGAAFGLRIWNEVEEWVADSIQRDIRAAFTL